MSELQDHSNGQEKVIQEMNNKYLQLLARFTKATKEVEEKNQKLQELSETAEQTKRELDESRKSQQQLQQELQELRDEYSHLNRRMKKILETTADATKELNIKQRLNDQRETEVWDSHVCIMLYNLL